MNIIKYVIIAILIYILCLGCRENSTVEPDITKYEYVIPQSRNDGWSTGSLSDVGINVERVSEMIDHLNSFSDQKIHSILIAKNNTLVFEKYFSGYRFNSEMVQSEEDKIVFGIDTLHYMTDLSKSVIPLLYGIALKDGNDISLSDYIKDHLTEYSPLFVNGKENITLQNLLSMSTGLAWVEYLFEYIDERSDIQKLLKQEDPIEYFLQRELLSEPGTRFDYNSGCTILLSRILEKSVNQNIAEYSNLKLFQPMGISEMKWDIVDDKYVNTSVGLHLTPRSLLKIGQLIANEGFWNGKQILPSNWINTISEPYAEMDYYFFANAYGLHIWKYDFEIYGKYYDCIFFAGWGEQYLFIFPDIDLVVSFTGGYYFEFAEISVHSIVFDYILSALEN